MNSFLKERIPKNTLIFSIILGLLISLIQIYQQVHGYSPQDNVFGDSPYTLWLSVDPFNFSPMVFFILVPLLASISTATLLRSDINNRFIIQLKIRRKISQIVKSYALLSFFTGFIAIIVPLLINFSLMFLFFPNINPDPLINSNLAVMNQNTLFVSMYYTHPFIHAILSIIFASFWGGLFALFTFVSTFFIKNVFVGLCSSFFLQIFLLILNFILKLPNDVSYVPMNFIRVTNSANVNIFVVLISSILMFFYCLAIIKYGGEKSIVW